MKKKIWAAVLAGTLALSTVGSSVVAYADDEKQDLVIMITNPGEVNNAVEERLKEKLGDKYNIITKTWDSASVEQTVKTAAAAGEQLDLVQYWPNQMNSFTSVGLATDLTDYMDDEWKEGFEEGTLDMVLMMENFIMFHIKQYIQL